jgi:hypothetical protein
MNWEVLQSVAELVGAAGVIISLIYLANQVRQNTREMRSAANQELLSSWNAITDFSTSEHGANFFHKTSMGDWESMSPAELAVYRLLSLKLFRTFEHAFLLHRDGLLTDDVWQGWRTQLAMSIAMPGMRTAWQPTSGMLNEEFVSFVESLQDESVHIAADYANAWKEVRPDWSNSQHTGHDKS